jgi:hypothetical protein
MPIQSKSQQRLMQAAAHTKGGFGGVSQSVGKDFVAAGPAKGKLPERKEEPSRADRRYAKSKR